MPVSRPNRKPAGSLLCLALLLAVVFSPLAASPPNIVLFLADDLGYEAIAANGGQSYSTPRLDALAATGIRFDNAYAQPLCTPTRVQVMTGKYNVRNYSEFGVLNASQVTFANLLRDAGYKTFVGGKWQLEGGFDGPIGFGFDEYFLWQITRRPQRYYAPGFEAHIPADGLNKTEVDYPAGAYGPDVVAGKIMEFIERNQSNSFLVYYPMMLTHSPFTPSPDHPSYSTNSTQELNDPMYFGSMVSYMDTIVGRIVQKLDDLGIRTNTLVLFLGDNGTGSQVTSMLDGVAIKGGKGKTTHAGIRTPLIANWPGTISAGRLSNALVDTSDILPTLCEVAGVPVPGTVDGRSFYAQLLGPTGQARSWSYCWYKAQNASEANVKEMAHTGRYKLYSTGQFYDTSSDRDEQSPLNVDSLTTQERAGFEVLSNALASFQDARLERTLAPRPNPAAWSLVPSPKGLGEIGMSAAIGTDANGGVEYQFRNVTLGRESAWQPSSNFTDAGLADETAYSYQVRMRDLVGNATEWSEVRSATTHSSPNPQAVVIEQPVTDGNAGGQNVGQSFTAPSAYDGWFLDTINFYAVTNTGGADSAYLSLYDGFTNRTSRGRFLSRSADSALNPRTDGVPITWKFTNIVLKAGFTYFAAVSDATGLPAGAGQGIPAQRRLVDVYSGGSRLNESGVTTSVDLRFTISARRHPSSYSQWALTLPPGAPTGFGSVSAPGAMPNGWKYFFGLSPDQNDPTKWPHISNGVYMFRVSPAVYDILWQIRYSPSLAVPVSSWQMAGPTDAAVLHDPLTGRVEFPLLNSDAGFLRLEISAP